MEGWQVAGKSGECGNCLVMKLMPVRMVVMRVVMGGMRDEVIMRGEVGGGRGGVGCYGRRVGEGVRRREI